MPNAIITAAPMRPINSSPASRPPAIATPNSGDWVAIVLRFEDPDDNVNFNHPERHALEIGRGSCGDAFSRTTRVGSCGNAGAIHLFLVCNGWTVHAHQCPIVIWS